MMKKIICLSILLMSSCGKENSAPLSVNLNLSIRFPEAVSRGSGRFEAFVKKVEFMKIVAENGARKKEYRFPPSKWETLIIPVDVKPKSASENLEVSVEIWDRLEDGFRRSYPVLIGKKSLSYKDFEKKDDPNLRIVLHAEGPIGF